MERIRNKENPINSIKREKLIIIFLFSLNNFIFGL